ncbi:DUF1365 domain-containing protein [Pseudoalteromonas xiamenensis]|uniref:DUF1365 domain-containing protein n=1 Tax=Pseudoalteromonas xiamenensis TaxID=882626 RepID=UPI001FCC5D38|nr:DUF1365 domain-containing protein [Pseudoalteromonas xiamenensis]
MKMVLEVQLMLLCYWELNLNSAVCIGSVHHARTEHAQHKFKYPIYMLWIELDDLQAINQIHWAIGTKFFNPIRFKQSDYLVGYSGCLAERAIAALRDLGINDAIEKTYVLCQARCFGFYFSPVNFFFYQIDGEYRYMVAEVSNTPWNQRHCYLVPLKQENVNFKKHFHVSPFMDLDMNYHWQVNVDENKVFVHIKNQRGSQKVFDASLTLKKERLSPVVIRKVLKMFPVMTFSVVKGIYWHALRLFLKRVPFIAHPGK